MSWVSWEHDDTRTVESVTDLSDKVLGLMRKVACESPSIGMNEYADAGVVVGDGTDILVYREMEEYWGDDTDKFDQDSVVDEGGYVTVPGYTLTVQWEDGQQWTESFFAEDDEATWRETADECARCVADAMFIDA